MKIDRTLIDGAGTTLWKGTADASYMGEQMSERDIYAEQQRAVIGNLLRKMPTTCGASRPSDEQ